MTDLKENAQEFLNASQKLGKSLFSEGQKLFDKHVKPKVNDVTDQIKRRQTLDKLNKEKTPVEQDKSKRKYHRGN